MYPMIITAIMAGACFAGAVYFACVSYLDRVASHMIMAAMMTLTSVSALAFLFQRLNYG